MSRVIVGTTSCAMLSATGREKALFSVVFLNRPSQKNGSLITDRHFNEKKLNL